jgi:hypothetical protein
MRCRSAVIAISSIDARAPARVAQDMAFAITRRFTKLGRSNRTHRVSGLVQQEVENLNETGNKASFMPNSGPKT